MAKTLSMVKTLSRGALMKRINRKLAHEGERLCKSRRPWDGEIGHYYVVDTNRNLVIAKDVDLEDLARELGVIHPAEKVAEDK
jgi:hypothetical protein